MAASPAAQLQPPVWMLPPPAGCPGVLAAAGANSLHTAGS
eukprot:CAMPEP_0202877766 /NCGR_PEP_ID=MMETSP1391-20130828/31129_1 /ASSEMBLY_ACC=CAM_ASM_000867 /TAXON_ID=1034604 /ORGANISM="Chlamydomonas leiostraca, Strain SAG 11-49" /LENGTH=39 /DNA_ID= /DNA_START= /DNA_END= /DNA_ORIENTATION=